MDKLSESELKTLLRRVDLDLTAEELEWVATTFNGYREQLDALHRADLEGEEVGTAFMPAGGAEESAP